MQNNGVNILDHILKMSGILSIQCARYPYYFHFKIDIRIKDAFPNLTATATMENNNSDNNSIYLMWV